MLWSLNVFFVLIAIEVVKVIFCQKHFCKWIATSNFEFSDIFLGAGHNSSCIKWFFSVTMITECLLFAPNTIRSYKVPFSKTSLRMHCNFKIWTHSNNFLFTGHNWPCTKQNIKILNTRKGQDIIMIRQRHLTHRISCKKSHSYCVFISHVGKYKNVVTLDFAHRWLIYHLSLWSVS